MAAQFYLPPMQDCLSGYTRHSTMYGINASAFSSLEISWSVSNVMDEAVGKASGVDAGKAQGEPSKSPDAKSDHDTHYYLSILLINLATPIQEQAT
jgi:hypothetical protein